MKKIRKVSMKGDLNLLEINNMGAYLPRGSDEKDSRDIGLTILEGRHSKKWLMLRNNILTRLNSEKRIEIQNLKRKDSIRHRDLTDTLPRIG